MTDPLPYILGTRDGRPTITCRVCGRTSYNPQDAAEHYCGACHLFLDGKSGELPPAAAWKLPPEA